MSWLLVWNVVTNWLISPQKYLIMIMIYIYAYMCYMLTVRIIPKSHYIHSILVDRILWLSIAWYVSISFIVNVGADHPKYPQAGSIPGPLIIIFPVKYVIERVAYSIWFFIDTLISSGKHMAYMNMFRGTLRNGSGQVGLHLLVSGMRREEEDGVLSSSDDSPRQTFVNFRTCEGPWAPWCLLNTWKHPLLASSTTFMASKWRPIKHGSVSSGTLAPLAVSQITFANPGAATWNLLNCLKLQVKFITFPLNIGFICGKCELSIIICLILLSISEEQNWRAQRLVEIEILLVISFKSPWSSAMSDFFLLNPTESRTDSRELTRGDRPSWLHGGRPGRPGEGFFFYMLKPSQYPVSSNDLLYWLVLWNMNGWFSHILGMSSSQLTNSYFFRGVGIPPTSLRVAGLETI